MSEPNQPSPTQPETAATPSGATFTQAQVDALVAAAKADAITGEAKRRNAINALAQPGFEAELQTALDSDQTPEAFALVCMNAAKERGVTLGAIRNSATITPINRKH